MNGTVARRILNDLAFAVRVAAVTALAALIASCGGGGAAPMPPTITAQPQNMSAALGQPASFSVTATGSGTLSYQWARNSSPIAGATSAAYTIPSVSSSDNSASYTVTVSNSAGGTTSSAAVLTVTPAVLVSLAITPNPVVSGVGFRVQMAATGTYSDGSTADATSAVTWSSSSPSVATVGASTGATLGVAVGSATIVATANSITASAGGRTPGEIPTANAELYDPVANSWSAVGAMSTVRAEPGAALLPSGKVLVVGGALGDGAAVPVAGAAVASAELFDPTTNTWSLTVSPSTARTAFTATLLSNGNVLAAGGTTVTGLNANISNAELYQ